MATTSLTDIITPEVFGPYMRQVSEQKSRLIQSGAVVRDSRLDAALAGGGITFNEPSFQDLADDADEVATGNTADHVTMSITGAFPSAGNPGNDIEPQNIDTSQEVQVRLSRAQAWGSRGLSAVMAGADPMEAVASRVANYWNRRRQAALVSTIQGVIADNVADDSGDYQNDISGSSYSAGVTDFSAEALIDTALTAGDSMDQFAIIMVHSQVFARMRKNNLIDFIRDSEQSPRLPFFHGLEVIVDDGLPFTGNVYDTWVFGRGAIRLGLGTPLASPGVEVEREPRAGNGAGEEYLITREEWAIHPVGHGYTGAAGAGGGPANTVLDDAGSWNRVYPERKQIKFARLVTREA